MDDMLATLHATGSVGLAAPQVNVPLRLVVIDRRRSASPGAADVSEEQDEPLVLLNPELLEKDTPCMTEEQCLSVPGFSAPISRSWHVRIQARGRDGEPFELDADGLLAVCIQHEIDHLDGKLFIDHLSWLKRAFLRRKLTSRPAAAPSS